MTTYSAEFEHVLTDLAWSLWTELGVRGVARHHQSWSIDPEALIVLTASLARVDPRLRDESLDWCLRNQRYISRSRLKNIARDVDDEARDTYERYSATL